MKISGLIGLLLFILSVIIGQFVEFAGDDIVSIALAAFGLATVVIGAIKNAKDKKSFSWVTVMIIILAVFGGVLVAIGGLASNLFAEIAGLVVAIVSILIGVITNKNAPE